MISTYIRRQPGWTAGREPATGRHAAKIGRGRAGPAQLAEATAPDGVNGPVGATRFEGGPVDVHGRLAEKILEGPDPDNACGWESLADLLDAMADGNTYVNVHTLAHPPGEIRGQVR